MNSKQIKKISATIGAGALLGLGTFAVVSSGTGSADPLPVVPQAQETSVTKTPDVVATPPITTAPYTIPTGEPQ